MDFHDTRPDWIEAADFIYSNSFDHSYDPQACLNAWMSCVRPGGLCIIEQTDVHTAAWVNELDPFGVEIPDLLYLILTWGKGRYGIRDMLDVKVLRKGVAYTKFIVIQKWS